MYLSNTNDLCVTGVSFVSLCHQARRQSKPKRGGFQFHKVYRNFLHKRRYHCNRDSLEVILAR